MTATLAILYGAGAACYIARGWRLRGEPDGRAILAGGLCLAVISVAAALLAIGGAL